MKQMSSVQLWSTDQHGIAAVNQSADVQNAWEIAYTWSEDSGGNYCFWNCMYDISEPKEKSPEIDSILQIT